MVQLVEYNDNENLIGIFNFIIKFVYQMVQLVKNNDNENLIGIFNFIIVFIFFCIDNN